MIYRICRKLMLIIIKSMMKLKFNGNRNKIMGKYKEKERKLQGKLV